MSEGRGEGTGGEGGEGGLRVRPYVSVFGCNWRGGRGGVQRAADARRLAWVFGSMCVEEGEFEGGRKSGGGEGQMRDGSRSKGRGREGGSLGVCVWRSFDRGYQSKTKWLGRWHKVAPGTRGWMWGGGRLGSAYV